MGKVVLGWVGMGVCCRWVGVVWSGVCGVAGRVWCRWGGVVWVRGCGLHDGCGL